MPYIKQERRAELIGTIDALVNALESQTPTAGDLNYVVTRLVLKALRPKMGWNYHSLSAAVSALQDAADEIKRRLLGPYEDRARDKNGDIPELEEFSNPFDSMRQRPPSC